MKPSIGQKSNVQTRPPVVVVMGHVDHGKTSILDYIRKAKVAEKEAGGITQSIGAYQVEHQGKVITFIDTPGHEAFSAMRARGAKVADIAVLVVAADDGIMPQTKEAISHIKHANIPMVVAINKVDKPNADPIKVKSQLLEEEIIVEDYQGKVPSVSVSAKTGAGIDGLLETVSLVAELEELKAELNTAAQGAVIEAQLDHRRGPVATLLVKEGILRTGDIVALSSTFGRIKQMESFRGERINEAGPATPVLVIGLETVPLVGDKFKAVEDLAAAERLKNEEAKKREYLGEIIEAAPETKIINILLKADSNGTLEAAHELIKGIKGESFYLRILEQGTGEIVEHDIKLAAAAKALIVGFRTKPGAKVLSFARQTKVDIIISEIVYDLVEKVRAAVSAVLGDEKKEAEIGRLKALAIFRTEKTKMIVGGKVEEGEIRRGVKARIIRADEIIGEGRIAQVKVGAKSAEKPVQKGQECGILFEGPVKILVGDIVQEYEIQERRIEL